jgi:flagellar biosynthesis/type III secretory pathway chaperone
VTTSAASAVRALYVSLGVETDLQVELGVALNREHHLLTAMSLEELARLETEKEALLDRIRRQAQGLKDCMNELAEAMNLPKMEILTLSGLINHLDEPDRTQLRNIQEHLIALAGAVRAQNRINDRLIHGSLSYVSQYLTLLRALVAGSGGYLSNGAPPEHQENGRILALKG